MNADEIQSKLAEPFHPDLVDWKPQTVKGDKALAVAYIDARTVAQRLDDVLGLGNWKDDFEVLPEGGSVVCRLSVRLGDEWVTKTDVGSPSEQPDGGDRMKAAFSDALKRAAVKLGVGRYLYGLPKQWCDYDPAKRRFVNAPKLPSWAMPRSVAEAPKSPPQAKQPPAREGKLLDTVVADGIVLIAECKSLDDLKRVWEEIYKTCKPEQVESLLPHKDKRKKDLTGGKP